MSRALAFGGRSTIYATDDPQIIIKDQVENNEAQILKLLSQFEYFPQYYDYDPIKKELWLEYFPTGLDLREITLTDLEKLVILFHLTYALYLTEPLQFNHNDLILKNILLVPSVSEEKIFTIDDKQFKVPAINFQVKIIDFDLSRLENYYNESIAQRYYQGSPVPYVSSVDVCKLWRNPLIVPKYISEMSDYEIFSTCQFNNFYRVVPPFPEIYPHDLFDRTFFELFRLG